MTEATDLRREDANITPTLRVGGEVKIEAPPNTGKLEVTINEGVALNTKALVG